MSKRKDAFAALEKHKKRLAKTHMRELFAEDRGRFRKFSAMCGDILLDYSKNRIDEEAMTALFDLARAAGVEERRDKHVGGRADQRHRGQGRDAHGAALRRRPAGHGRRRRRDARCARGAGRISRQFTDQVRNGEIRGATGEQFTDVVNIGIGGSDLGPAMVTLALAPYTRPDLRAHYVSNVDGAHINDTLYGLDPASDAVHHRLEDLHHRRDHDQRRIRRANGWPTR